MIIERTKALPHLLNLSRQAEAAIDEMHEQAFALLTITMYAGNSGRHELRQAV